MVIAVDHVAEAVMLPPSIPSTHTSVCSLMLVDGHRRYREEVQFSPVLSAVKFSDTHYIQTLTSSRRRYVSRTFYEPRVRPRRYAETTFTSPTAAQQLYVSYVDHGVTDRRRYKTTVQVKPRRFRSSVDIPMTTDVNSNALTSEQTRVRVELISDDDIPNGHAANERVNGDPSNADSRADRFEEMFDPGASQVFIPKKRDWNMDVLMNGGVSFSFPNQNGVILDPPQRNGGLSNGHDDVAANSVLNRNGNLSNRNSKVKSYSNQRSPGYSEF